MPRFLLFIDKSWVISGTDGASGEGEVLTADSEGGITVTNPDLFLPLQQAGQLRPPASPAGVSWQVPDKTVCGV